MKLSRSDQESLVALLTRIYEDIRALEQEFQLLVGGGDFRPRIEYFHDALRAFTSQEPGHWQPGGRLCVELLAYDVSCLRYLQGAPLASFKPHGDTQSPRTELMKQSPRLAVRPKRPDRPARERLSELYQHYAVLFAALLKPAADRDYHERVDSLNQDVEDIHALIHALEALKSGKGSQEKIGAAIGHIEEDGLRQELMHFMAQKQHKKADALATLVAFLKQHSAKKDKEIAAIDSAHMNYAMAQLGIFEDSKDMLKKLASQGMNLIGKFVAGAMAETRRDMGRGGRS